MALLGCARRPRWDLYHTHAQDRKELESIEPYTSATSH